MSEAKPRALELADQLDNTSVTFDHEIATVEQAAALLRQQHAAIVELREALKWREQFMQRDGEDANDTFERVAEVFRRETGYLRPGKDCRMYSNDERQAVWDEWIAAWCARTRATLTNTEGL